MFHPQGPTFFELAQQALSSTLDGYDLLAPKFDVTPFRTPAPIIEEVGKVLMQAPEMKNGIDICCGTGAGIEMLRTICTHQVTGIDFSAGMLNQARLNLYDRSLDLETIDFDSEATTNDLAATNEPTGDSIDWEEAVDLPALVPKNGATSAGVRLIRGDVFEMSFEEEFEVAVCFGALGHILPAREDQFIAKVNQCLRPGGRFLFATTIRPSLLHPAWWAAHGFNAAMHVRNLCIRPEFIMYYLTFTWPDIEAKLSDHGFSCRVHQPFKKRGKLLRIVEAVKEASEE